MKIKTNFVTNSSTCNFVMIGFHINTEKENYKMSEQEIIECIINDENIKIENIDEIENIIEEANDFHILRSGEDGTPNDNTIIIGYHLATYSSDNYDWSKQQINLNALTDIISELRKKFGYNGEMNLYFSTRLC